MGPTRGELVLGLPLACVAGLLVGALGTFKHQVVVGPAGLPIGLVLSLLMVAAVVAALRAAFETRLFAAAGAVGVAIAAVVLAQPGPGGSAVVSGAAGTWWVAGALVLAAVFVVVPRPRFRKRQPADGILDAHSRTSEGTDS